MNFLSSIFIIIIPYYTAECIFINRAKFLEQTKAKKLIFNFQSANFNITRLSCYLISLLTNFTNNIHFIDFWILFQWYQIFLIV